MELVAKSFLYAIAAVVFAVTLAFVWVPCLPVTLTLSLGCVPS